MGRAIAQADTMSWTQWMLGRCVQMSLVVSLILQRGIQVIVKSHLVKLIMNEVERRLRDKEIGLALGVADKLQVVAIWTQRVHVFLLANVQGASQFGEHCSRKCLHLKSLMGNEASCC